MKVFSLLVTGAGRTAVLLTSLGFAVAGTFSAVEPPSVSTWVDMQIAVPIADPPSECGNQVGYPGRTRRFVDTQGQVYLPAVEVGGEIPLVSFRTLDRDIEGTFHAALVSADIGYNAPLLDFEFSQGMFPGVQAGCRVSAFSYSLTSDSEPAMNGVLQAVAEAAGPTRWRLVQTIDIAGARSESWSSELFWIIPAEQPGEWFNSPVSIIDPFHTP